MRCTLKMHQRLPGNEPVCVFLESRGSNRSHRVTSFSSPTLFFFLQNSFSVILFCADDDAQLQNCSYSPNKADDRRRQPGVSNSAIRLLLAAAAAASLGLISQTKTAEETWVMSNSFAALSRRTLVRK